MSQNIPGGWILDDEVTWSEEAGSDVEGGGTSASVVQGERVCVHARVRMYSSVLI